jgi:prepilin-type N-terminal cleavage/methylation domain-containing protein
MMVRTAAKTAPKGFTLVEIMVTLAILGILATISIPNFKRFVGKAELASMMTTLKYLMDGEDFYLFENNAFFAVNIPSGTAMDIPELAYSFSEGHKNRYRITVINNPARPRYRYRILVVCDFDSDGDGTNDRFTATTNIVKGKVRKNRLIVKTR